MMWEKAGQHFSTVAEFRCPRCQRHSRQPITGVVRSVDGSRVAHTYICDRAIPNGQDNSEPIHTR
jgi:hypothetical protein